MGVPNGNGEDFAYVAVEFDTMLDPSVGDVNGNHVGIDVGSVVSVASVDGFSKGIDLKAGRLLTAWIEYRSGEDMIKVKETRFHVFGPFLFYIYVSPLC